ncbi:serine hydrolase [Pseudolactococcus yaeyamensis]
MQEMVKNKKNYLLLQWLVFAAMVLPAFFTFPEKTDIVNSQTYTPKLLSDKAELSRWSEMPKRAVTLKEIQSYTDANLQIKAKKIPAKTHLMLSSLEPQSLRLLDGTFVSNNKNEIGSDVILTTEIVSQPLYVIQDVNVLYTPLTTFDTQVYSKLMKGNKVLTSKKATTHWGIYYQVAFEGGKTGWIDSQSATFKNPKLDRVQTLLNQKYQQTSYSIYVKQLDSVFTAGVNQTQKMYSASLSKLPILYWTQKQINAGNASLGDSLAYNELVNGWQGAFKTEGTGFLPKTADYQSYSLLDLINRTAKDSDNVASNMLAYYETDKFSESYQSEITKVAGQPWNPIEREASSEMVGRVLEALYYEGGAGYNSLIGTDYDTERIPAKLPKSVQVAHKIGTADEFNHDAALIFASEPYILVIETSHDADNEELANISQAIYEVMK